MDGEDQTLKAGKRRGVTVKKLKRALKKAGLKVTGKRSTLVKRAKKAHLTMKGGAAIVPLPLGGGDVQAGGMADYGGRRRTRRGKSRKH